MADAARTAGIARPDPNLIPDTPPAPDPVVTPTDDGGAVVNFDGETPGAAATPAGFADDLTPLFSDSELARLGSELVQTVMQDDRSRDEWKKTYARGLKLLGLNYEDRTQPWENACGAFHPMLLESVIRFNAQAMMDLFPGSGPIKTKIVGRITDEKERQADRVKTDLNWIATERMVGYRSETDMMLFNLPLAGTTFRKFYFDTRRQCPAAEYVLPEHVIMPYTASSLDSTDYTVVLPKTRNWVETKMAAGFYRDVDLPTPTPKSTKITEERDKIEGRRNTAPNDTGLLRLYECYFDRAFDGLDPLVTDKLAHPYVITVDSSSNKVLSIRRNWRENDPAMERQVSLVQHKYMPGFGPYGIGLVNILGGLTESATSILRQLVDAGSLANLRGGFKTKSARMKDDSTPIGPAEWRDVEVSAGTLKDAFMPLPYGEPSSVLAALLGQIVDEGRRIGSVADMKITDMTGQNMPVGTTLAIIERSMKVMSAVQQRLYESFKVEFGVIAEIAEDFMGEMPYPFEIDERDQQTVTSRAVDYDGKVDIIPVADPNATTMAQRIMVVQAVIQLYQAMPTAGWNTKNLAHDFVTVLGSDKADYYLPPDEETQPADPVTENMNILTGKPVKAGINQDHEAHITAHTAAANDPRIAGLLANNPSAQAINATYQAHLMEHTAMWYFQQMQEQLGVSLPPPGQPLPDDVEYSLSKLIAAAGSKLLDKDRAEVQQREILDKLQDPVIQNETEALRIKADKVQKDYAVAIAKLEAGDADKEFELLITMLKQRAETERATLVAEIQKGSVADEMQLREAEIAARTTTDILNAIVDMQDIKSREKIAKEKKAAA